MLARFLSQAQTATAERQNPYTLDGDDPYGTAKQQDPQDLTVNAIRGFVGDDNLRGASDFQLFAATAFVATAATLSGAALYESGALCAVGSFLSYASLGYNATRVVA